MEYEVLTDVERKSIEEYVKSKILDQFAIASETGLLLNHQYYELSEIIRSWLKKSQVDSDQKTISNKTFVREFNGCINNFIYDSLSPLCHSFVSYKNGHSTSIPKLISERLFQVQGNDESITDVYSKDDSKSYLRLFSFYNEYKYSWDESWILDRFDNYNWYRGCFLKSNIPGICGSAHTIIGALEPEDSGWYYVYASNKTEAQALILSRFFGDNRLVNGIIPIERVFKDYSYYVDWQSFVVESLDEEYEDSSSFSEDKKWSLIHLGFFLPESHMIDPNSIWLKPSSDGSFFTVNDAYSWYKTALITDEELYCREEFYLNEIKDFFDAGLIPYNDTDYSDCSLLEYKKTLLLFRESYEELISHEIIKPFSKGAFWLYAFDEEDAGFKFQTYAICSIFNMAEQKTGFDDKNSGNYKSFLKNERDSFLTIQELPIEESFVIENKCFIGVPFNLYKKMLDTIGKKKGCFPFIGIKTFERRRRFSFLQNDNLYILHYSRGDFIKTLVCFGSNSKEAYGEVTKDDEDPSYEPMDVNVYSPYTGKVSGFSFNASFFAYFLLYLKGKEVRNG